MASTTLVAIPEDELRMYKRTLAAVQARTACTLARCEEARKRRENPWYKQLSRAIGKLPKQEKIAISCIIGGMFAVVVFNAIFLPIVMWRCGS